MAREELLISRRAFARGGTALAVAEHDGWEEEEVVVVVVGDCEEAWGGADEEDEEENGELLKGLSAYAWPTPNAAAEAARAEMSPEPQTRGITLLPKTLTEPAQLTKFGSEINLRRGQGLRAL